MFLSLGAGELDKCPLDQVSGGDTVLMQELQVVVKCSLYGQLATGAS
jgi:hypothetical protein